MLHFGHPAIGERLAERLVVLVDAELLVLLAVVHGRTAERIALDVEHRPALRIHVPRKLHVRGRLPVGARGVLHVIDHFDGVLARLEDVGLRDGDALPVRPRQRHAQFLRARRETEFAGRRGVQRKVRGFGTAVGRAQAAAHDAVRRVVGRQQAHRGAARLLVARVLQQVGAQQVAALQADVHVDHVGDDTDTGSCSSNCSWSPAPALRRQEPPPPAQWLTAAQASSMRPCPVLRAPRRVTSRSTPSSRWSRRTAHRNRGPTG